MGPARIHRYDSYEAKSVGQNLPELHLWVSNGTSSSRAEGQPDRALEPGSLLNHPLLKYSINPAGHSPKAWNQSPFKVILQPQNTIRVHVHQGDPMEGREAAKDVEASCAR